MKRIIYLIILVMIAQSMANAAITNETEPLGLVIINWEGVIQVRAFQGDFFIVWGNSWNTHSLPIWVVIFAIVFSFILSFLLYKILRENERVNKEYEI